MNAFDYDSWQKKIIARGSIKRKCGSKSKKCSLPSDGMTQKEWKEKCGVVNTYNMKSPMQWNKFSILPDDLKREYITSIQKEYGVNIKNLSEMFGESYGRVYKVIFSLGVSFPCGKVMNDEQRKRWATFIGGEINSDEDKKIMSVEEFRSGANVDKDVNANAPVEIERKTSTTMSQLSMKFTGDINVSDIANSLLMILGKNSTGEVQIICNLTI